MTMTLYHKIATRRKFNFPVHGGGAQESAGGAQSVEQVTSSSRVIAPGIKKAAREFTAAFLITDPGCPGRLIKSARQIVKQKTRAKKLSNSSPGQGWIYLVNTISVHSTINIEHSVSEKEFLYSV
jgi:hypothetical protein